MHLPKSCAALVLAALLTYPAQAEACLMAEDLTSGIHVTVKDGSVQTFRTKGRDVLADVPLRHKNQSGFDARQTLLRGLLVTSDQRLVHDAPQAVPDGAVLVGGNEGGTQHDTYRFAGKPPVPKPGTIWTTEVRIERAQDGPSIGPQPRIKVKAVVQVVFLAQKTVELSGCACRIIPVETTISLGKDSRFSFGTDVMPLDDTPPGTVILTRRQIWFDDLGFAVTTQEGGEGFDWVEPWGQGIIAMGPLC